MRITHLLISFFVLIVVVSPAQQWEWGKSINAGNGSEMQMVKTDNLGNLIVLGYTDTSINYETVVIDSGFYLARFQSDGLFLWAKSLPHAFNAKFDIYTNGDIVVVGSYVNSFSFDQLNIQSSGGTDIFLTRLNSEGAAIWLKSFGGNFNDFGAALVLDSLNIYITGTISTSANFDALILNDTSTNIHYISKIDPFGVATWLQKSTYSGSKGIDIGIGENGNIYTIGMIDCTNNSSWSHCDQYTMKLSSVGTPVFTNVFGSPSKLSYIKCKEDQVYIHQSSCSPGACFSSISKYDTQMNLKWTKVLGTSFSDYWVSNIVLGNDKSIYAYSSFASYNPLADSVQFDSIAIQVNHQQNLNAAIVKMDTAGAFQMVSTFYIKNNGYGLSPLLAVDNNYNCFLAGTISSIDTVTFGNENFNCYSKNFILKLSDDNIVTSNYYSWVETKALDVYPNPSFGVFTITLTNNTDAKVCVYDVLGNCVWSKTNVLNSPVEADLTDQAKGVYFVEVVGSEQKKVSKIIIN